MPTPPSATDLASAIANIRWLALQQFNAAFTQITTPPLSDPEDPNLPDAQKKERAANLAKAQAQMASALQQLVHADTMLSEQRGRDGYAALVTLMESTEDTAASAYLRIKQLMSDTSGTATDQQARNQQLTTLAGVLQALARIAPTPVWQKVPSSGGASG